MTIHLDGADVHYAGAPRPGGPGVGDAGKVLIADERAAHVRWTTGSRAGDVDLVEHDDLASAATVHREETVRAHLGQSLSFEGDPGGPEQVLAAMAEAGDLARLSLIAEETMEYVAGRLRTLGTFRVRTAALEPDETDDLIRVATRQVLAEALESLEDLDES